MVRRHPLPACWLMSDARSAAGTVALAALLPRTEADKVAEGIAAMVDGFYIRRALKDGLPNPLSAVAVIEDYLDAKLAVQK